MKAIKRASRRLGAILFSLFRPVDGGKQNPETQNNDIAVEAMLIGRSCCG